MSLNCSFYYLILGFIWRRPKKHVQSSAMHVSTDDFQGKPTVRNDAKGKENCFWKSQVRASQLMPAPRRRREWLPLLQQEQRPAKGVMAGWEFYLPSCWSSARGTWESLILLACSRMERGAVGGEAELAAPWWRGLWMVEVLERRSRYSTGRFGSCSASGPMPLNEISLPSPPVHWYLRRPSPWISHWGVVSRFSGDDTAGVGALGGAVKVAIWLVVMGNGHASPASGFYAGFRRS